MARDRKRAKQRRDRARRTSGVTATPRPRSGRADDPLEHQSAEADLAEAQLALGRSGEDEDEDDGSLIRAEAEHDGEPYVRDDDGAEIAPDELEEASDRVTTPGSRKSRGDGAAVREHHAPSGNRVTGFLQASWRELQRVQWPDRRQVTQATGVVLAFVIIAGLYLGLADEIFSKLVDAIL